MISRLRGTLLARRGGTVIVEAGGIGYRVMIPPNSMFPDVGEEVVVHTYLHVREDALNLFGFVSEKERDLFEVLLACQGVGPKVALACLSVFDPETLAAAVMSDDVAALQRVPGIGQRSAEKLLFELKPRLGPELGDGVLAGVSSGQAEVREALAGLGYADREVGKVLQGLSPNGDTSQLLREALRVLGGRT